jgi:thioredoxin-related protein
VILYCYGHFFYIAGMARIIITHLLLLVFVAASAQKPLSADDILKEASQVAAKQNKNVFIIFHASWCGWCHRMDSLMTNQYCKKFFDDHYVVRHLVVLESDGKKALENPGAVELLQKYKAEKQGIPFWLIYDPKGNLLADSQSSPGVNTGCPATREEVDHFLKVLQKTSPLTKDQLAVIEKNFLKVD